MDSPQPDSPSAVGSPAIDDFPRTGRTTPLRDRERMSYHRAMANAIIDEAYVCHVGFTVESADAGPPEPRVLPTLHVRVDDILYIHGSTGSRPLLAARSTEGLPVCVTVTQLDGIVFARSQFNHSANYRSVIAHGSARLVTDEPERSRVLTALVDKMAPGRSADSRPPSPKELAQTALLALPLTEVSVKTRVGGVDDDPEDLDLPHWAGVVPLRLLAGLPEPEPGVTGPVPEYLRPGLSPWLTPAVMRGRHVILEPLDLSHAEELYHAIADDDVYRFLGRPRPACVDDMADEVRDALRMHANGVRVPWVQRSAETGEVVGTTSYHDIDEGNRRLAIGHTQLARRWWRTGINTEAKLLLLARAFEDLSAVRVAWHTDVRNERSQRAIERLGAVREGLLRRHKRRADGTWRDTVAYSMTDAEWPTAQLRLEKALLAGAAQP